MLVLPNFGHIRTLRSNTEIRITPFEHRNSFTYRGLTVSNVLPENIKKLESENKFISAVKQHFFDQAYAYALQTAN